MPPYTELQPITEAMLTVRGWEEEHLPMERSALAYDLLAVTAHHTVVGTPLSLKHLFTLLNYSEAGVRKQLRRCIRDGWINLESVSNDKRVRVVVAQPKLLLALKEYADLLRNVYSK
jgi:DNA-binding MarR family transcriptional regulator